MKMNILTVICSFLSTVNCGSPHQFGSHSLPENLNYMPTLGNGHLGFTVFGDLVFMNGLYNGKHGLSHRAGIPNVNNIQIKLCSTTDYDKNNCYFEMDVKMGIFKVFYVDPSKTFKLEQHIYAHRFYNRAIVNHISLTRLTENYSENINIKLHDKQNQNSVYNDPWSHNDDFIFNSSKTIYVKNYKIEAICGHTRELEEINYQKSPSEVCVLWNHVPEEITLQEGSSTVTVSFLMVVDGNFFNAKAEMMEMIDALESDSKSLIGHHKSEWESFWEFGISVEGNPELSSIISSSIFYIASSLPSLNTFQKNNIFYGISPTGLGRGSSLDDYEGHNFWDSEIYMQPVIGIFNPQWMELLLKYRYLHLNAAKQHAKNSGFKGARFPWESAFTGTEVTQPCCPLVAENQIHISADISHALRFYFSLTHALTSETCELSNEISKYWLSRISFNNITGYYDINGVMGPDEDNENVDNDVFTNAVAAYAIYFGSFSKCFCNMSDSENWDDIAKSIKLLYDERVDYHPQFEGYTVGTPIKQADVILLNFPLLYKMNDSTRLNDLKIYENVTRASGPAMTHAVASIGYLDSNELEMAAKLFEKSYQPFVHQPFFVWSEMEQQKGAVNFLTGSGGFLQAILYGFLGIKIRIQNMTIQNSHLLPNTTALSTTFLYLSSKFYLSIESNATTLTCLSLNSNNPLKIHMDDEEMEICENEKYSIAHKKVVVASAQSNFGGCQIPADIIGLRRT